MSIMTLDVARHAQSYIRLRIYIYIHSPHRAYVYITRSKPPWAPAEHTFNNSLVAVIKFALGRLGLLAERPTTISANVYELQSTSPTNIDAAWLAGSLHHHHGLGTVARHVDKCVFNVEGYGWICTTVALMYTSPRYGHNYDGRFNGQLHSHNHQRGREN